MLRWFPSSSLGTHALQAPACSLTVPREAGASKTHSQAGAWERAKNRRSGGECRNPEAMEGGLDSPTCVLDTGNSCRYDGNSGLPGLV